MRDVDPSPAELAAWADEYVLWLEKQDAPAATILTYRGVASLARSVARGEGDARAEAERIVHAWIRDSASVVIQMRMEPKVARPLIEAIAAALAARDAGRGVIGEIAAERRRQVDVEGWTAEHDDNHKVGQMAMAAACYADPVPASDPRITKPMRWPWDAGWWKPGADWRLLPTCERSPGRRGDLIKAAALIVAEIERLDRAALPAHGTATPAALTEGSATRAALAPDGEGRDHG